MAGLSNSPTNVSLRAKRIPGDRNVFYLLKIMQKRHLFMFVLPYTVWFSYQKS